MSLTRTRHPGIYRRADKYVAVVAYRGPSGKTKRKWITRRTLKAALTGRRLFLDQIDSGLRPGDGRMTLGDFLESVWLPEVEAGTAREKPYRALTVKRYQQAVRDHLVPGLGSLQLAELDQRRLRQFYRSLPSRSLARYCHSVLSSALGWAVKDRGILAANPCASVRPPTIERKEARHLDDEGARRLLSVAGGQRIEPAVVLGLVGGLRISEAAGLRWADVQLEGKRLFVRPSTWGETKSGKPRGITLPESTVAVLRRWKSAQAQELLRLGVRQEDETPVLTNPAGRSLTPRMLAVAFGNFCREFAFDITFHGLRHTSAILMLKSGIDVKTVASRLGHANPALLFTVYSHFIESADQAAAERLEAALG